MQRVLRNSFNAALLAFLSLVVVAISPVGGVASAAPSSSICDESENCFLEISAPMSVQAGEPFTVKVALKFGNEPPMLVPKSDSCSKIMVTLDVWGAETVSYSAKASAGVATFNISVPTEAEVPDSRNYYMEAYVGEGEPCDFSDGSTYFDALTLPAGQPMAPCPNDVSCVQTTSGGGSAATLFADEGTFSPAEFEEFISGNFPGCPGAGPLDPTGVLSFDLDTPASKTIVFALNSNLVNKGIGQFNVCWSSPNFFTPLGGPPLVQSGLLPACMKNDAGPCVLFKTSTQHNGALIGVKAPPGDPKGFAY